MVTTCISLVTLRNCCILLTECIHSHHVTHNQHRLLHEVSGPYSGDRVTSWWRRRWISVNFYKLQSPRLSEQRYWISTRLFLQHTHCSRNDAPSFTSLKFACNGEFLVTNFLLKDKRRTSKMQRDRLLPALFNKYGPVKKEKKKGMWSNFKTAYFINSRDTALIT
jgi:hypothetical protein